jgi:hypothetical protein
MNWLQQNKFLGAFLIALGGATLLAIVLLLLARSGFNNASDRLNETATELNRLQNLNPFPNDANLQAMKAQTAEYGVAIDKAKEELKTRALPVRPMQPNEFQARLRETVTKVVEKARTNRVKLPENFFLGFDEFSAALPSNDAAPLLGQQLAQVELIANILIDARIDAINAFKRQPLPEERASATPTPAASRGRRNSGAVSGPKLIGRSRIEATFASSPSAARRVINQIASATQQFYIIRTLHVVNEKDKGPARAQSAPQAAAPEAAAAAGTKSNAALNFIVGTEHIQTSADIELIRFKF